VTIEKKINDMFLVNFSYQGDEMIYLLLVLVTLRIFRYHWNITIVGEGQQILTSEVLRF
jgi:hypothetical protein